MKLSELKGEYAVEVVLGTADGQARLVLVADKGEGGS